VQAPRGRELAPQTGSLEGVLKIARAASEQALDDALAPQGGRVGEGRAPVVRHAARALIEETRVSVEQDLERGQVVTPERVGQAAREHEPRPPQRV
jgi:hypothetical protein